MYLSSRMITSVSPRTNSSFLLTGFSGMEQQYPWFSIPFSSIYAMVLLGNCMVLHVIWTEPSLHQPMFYFLSMLALTDLCMRLSTVYTVLGILWGSFERSAWISALPSPISSMVCPSSSPLSSLLWPLTGTLQFAIHFLAVASLEERHKLFQTCISHVCAVLEFYMPIISLTMVHHFGKYLSPVAHVLIGNIYILFPPLMNPIIYSVKTQQIHTRMLRLFSLKRY
uniref:Olfactory receptor family 51 subfamily V member 1 n=1 Tax=Rhinopithecus bieti TaxID=61621 RepID=A0A2K6KDN1_RHIBE